jgi:cytochrome P450
VKLKFGPLSVYLVSNAAYLQQILRDANTDYEKPEMLYGALRKVMGNGLVTSSGDFWLRQRRMIQPHLHRKQLPLLYNDMVGAITAVLDTWEPRIASGEVFDLHTEMSKITMEIITRTMFGNGVLSEAESEVVSDMMNILAEYVGKNGFLGMLPEWMPFPGKKKFTQAQKTVHRIVGRLIERCREQGENASGLIKMLLNTVDEATNQQMTDQQLFDEIMTVFAAGFETTASVLTWLWTVLDRHPDVAVQLQAEVNAVVGADIPQLEHLPRLDFTRKVILELMRLHTIVPMLPRKAKTPITLGNHALPAGTMVLMFFHGVHHNPQLWDNPPRFDPTRFDAEAAAQRHPFAYLPFSGGPRKCAGDELALMEGQLAIAMIMQRFSITLQQGQDFAPHISITLRPHYGVKAKISVRTNAMPLMQG